MPDNAWTLISPIYEYQTTKPTLNSSKLSTPQKQSKTSYNARPVLFMNQHNRNFTNNPQGMSGYSTEGITCFIGTSTI